MSNSYTASKRFSTNSTSLDTNQKEIMISQLKGEILELRQNEREYMDLASQVKKFEQRYRLLQDDTTKDEDDFKVRNKQNFETIVNLRTDIDTLKRTIVDTKQELQDLRVENQTTKDVAEQKNKELGHFRNEVTEAFEENELACSTKRRLETELEVAREEKRKNVAQIKEARDTLSSLNFKVNELEKAMKEMEYNNSKTERHNVQLQQAIDNLASESKTKSQNLDTVEQQVSDSQKAILGLGKEIGEAERENERIRIENTQKQKIYQQEVTKNLDLTAKITAAENMLKARELELEELRRAYENLKSSHSAELDNNFQLKQDLESVQTDIDGLVTHNAEIVEELDRLALEDEQVRSLLNRRDRVEALKFKSESQLRKSGYRSKGQLSPSPDRNANRSSLKKSPSRTASSFGKSPYKY